jgi:N-methylhydantoinase B
VSDATKTFDPVLLAVLSSRFEAITREMMNTLFRTGRSAVLAMSRDFSCAIVTADDQLLTCADGIPVHVFGAHLLTEAMSELHPDLREGDAFLHNDPYRGNTHAADHTLLVPVFHEGRHLFTVTAKAHQADCGNSEPTTYMPFPRDVYEEGAVVFPCVRVQSDYRDNEDIIRMCRSRIRVPDQWYGDYLASVGAVRIGERRIKALLEQYGAETIETFVGEWLDYSERRCAQAISRLPKREVTASGQHDPFPALPDGLEITVTARIDPDAGRIEVDLRDNPDCVPAGINQTMASSISNATIGVFNSLGGDIPRNAGSFRRLDVLVRENCCAGIPRFPHSCSMATTNISGLLVNTTQRAFAALGDGWGLAEGGNSLGPGQAVISGKDPARGGDPYVNQLFAAVAGGPASPSSDGWITFLHTVAAGVQNLDSVEVIEQKYPLRVRSRGVVQDSGGPGRFRGAPGTRITFGPEGAPMMAMHAMTDAVHPPRGVHGGLSGAAARAAFIDRDGRETPLPPIPLEGTALQPGEWIVGQSSGGGGYGSPLERDPARVLHDVLEGYVSAVQARDVYGVLLTGDADGEAAPVVDAEATAALRERLAAEAGTRDGTATAR